MSKDLPPILERKNNPSDITPQLGEMFGKKNKLGILTGEIYKTVSGIHEVQQETGKIIKEAIGSLSGILGNTLQSSLVGVNEEKKEGGLFGTGDPFKGPLTKNKIKQIDPGAVYLGSLLGGDEKGDKKGFDLSAIAGTIEGALTSALGLKAIAPGLAKLGPMLLKASPFLAIAGGVVMGVMDGIQGALKAEEWGVSKVAGFLGGFISGTGEGWKNAFKNAGKWALIGAGTGFLVGGPPGAIIGGIAGGAIGGLLGFFGGEKTAQMIQRGIDALMSIDLISDLVNMIKAFGISIWNAVKQPFVGLIDGILSANRLKEIWGDDEKSFAQKLGESLANIGEMLFSGIIGWVTGAFTGLRDFFMDFFVGRKDQDGERTEKAIGKMLIDLVMDIGRGIGEFFTGLFTGVFRSLRNTGSRLFDAGKLIRDVVSEITMVISSGFNVAVDGAVVGLEWFTNSILTPIGNFFGGVFTSIGAFVSDAVATARRWFTENIWVPIRDFFSNAFQGAKAFVDNAITDTRKWFRDNIFDPVGGFFTSVGTGAMDAIGNTGEWIKGLWRGLRDSITNFFSFSRDDKIARNANISAEEVNNMFAGSRFMGGSSSPDRYHQGGIAPYEKIALLKKDEEVLSPSASKTYRDTIQNASSSSEREAISNLERLSREQNNDNNKLLDEIKNLVAMVATASGNTNVQTNNYTSRFSPMNVMTSLTMESL